MTGAEGDGTIEDLVYKQTTQTMLSQEKNHVSGIDANPKRLVCGLYIGRSKEMAQVLISHKF